MNRKVIAGHKATEVNPPWTLERVTGEGGVDEYTLDTGCGWLTLDPRRPEDREQMRELGMQLILASQTVTTGARR